MWIDYHAFLAIAIATHAIVGYVLGEALFGRPKTGVAGALAADLDFLFPAALGWPFVHRGLTHSILVFVVATAAVVAWSRVAGRGSGEATHRAAGGAFAVAYLSHLLIDATTPTGVPLLYPLSAHGFYADLTTTGHSPLPTVFLWIVCIGLLYREATLAVLWETLPVATDE